MTITAGFIAEQKEKLTRAASSGDTRELLNVVIGILETVLIEATADRARVLEEAAKVADDKEDGLVNHSKRFPTNPDIAHEYLVRATDASDIATAIRALKDKTNE